MNTDYDITFEPGSMSIEDRQRLIEDIWRSFKTHNDVRAYLASQKIDIDAVITAHACPFKFYSTSRGVGLTEYSMHCMEIIGSGLLSAHANYLILNIIYPKIGDILGRITRSRKYTDAAE
jgi:hypothetical protein